MTARVPPRSAQHTVQKGDPQPSSRKFDAAVPAAEHCVTTRPFGYPRAKTNEARGVAKGTRDSAYRYPGRGHERTAGPDAEPDAPTEALDPETYRHLRRVIDRLVSGDSRSAPSDVDAVFSIAMRRVEAGRATVVDGDRYASWVTVVGRNAFLNYRRSRPHQCVIREDDLTYDAEGHMECRLDTPIVRAALVAAIDRLPPFLRPVARMRFVEEASYELISVRTGKEAPTIRAYVHRAASKLRQDRGFTRVINDEPTRSPDT